MGKMKDALVKLARKVTGKEVKDENSISNVVNFMADNYTGGGSGGATLYTHNIDLAFLDGCDETVNIIFRVISSSESAYDATSVKTLFNLGPEGQAKYCGLFNNAIIETSESGWAFGDLSYDEEGDAFTFSNNVGNTNYDVSNLTLQTITDNPVEM